MSFTPGPWEVVGPSQDGHCRRIFAGDEFVAIVGGSDQSMKTIIANADLIAAAPDLLEALESLTDSIECYIADNKPREEWDEYDHMMLPRWQKAKAAIAKARGEA